MIQDHRRAMDALRIVNWFMTPFALVLVMMGIYFGKPDLGSMRLAVVIVMFTCWANVASLYVLEKHPSRMELIRKTRVVANYLFNLGLLYLLLPVWKPIWMLLLLTILAVAIYETREGTIVHAALFTFMLLFVGSLRGMLKGAVLGELIMYAATIWFAGLFVNALIALNAPKVSGRSA